ncbi:MAG: hypothetical protein M3R39_01585 [Actinomycetota bacterium]|nr:hypothetical protein [Actinomycetota bacterium]
MTVGAGTTFVSLFAGFGVIAGALAFKIAEDADSGIVLALSDLSWALGVLIAFPAAALVAAISIGSLRLRVLPELLCWAGILATLALLAAGTTWARDGFWAPDGAYAYIALISFMAWVLVASIARVLWSREAPTTAAVPTA